MNENPRSPAETLGVLGDVHCEHEALELALGLFARRGVDRILCVGDLTDGPGNLERTCELLQQHDVLTVAGNHERWFLGGALRDLKDATRGAAEATQEYLRALPQTREVQTVAGKLLLCHGLGTHDMATLRPDDQGYALSSNAALQELISSEAYAVVVSGHSHRRLVRRLGGTLFVNAGTLFREHDPVVLILRLGDRVAEYLRPDGSPVEVIPLPPDAAG